MQARPLTDAEITEIAKRLPSLRDRCLFTLGCRTGFRISELLSLTVADVTQYGAISDVVTVKRCNVKGKRSSRTIPLHEEAKHQLKLYITSDMSQNQRLFDISRQHAWRIIKSAARVAQLQGTISTHSMRKSFGMNVYTRTGKNVVAAQRALGHVSLASTSHYLSIGQDEVDAAILA